MSERERVLTAAREVAAAIGRRDVTALAGWLAPGFVARSPGGSSSDAGTFLRAVEQIPGEILAVDLHQVEIDLFDDEALVTGLQHAQVRLDGNLIDDRRAFVDYFARIAGEWRIRVAVDLPSPP